MGTFQATHKSTIQSKFEKFDRENPLIYERFKAHAFKAINKGKKKISSKLIINVIRWEEFMITVGDDIFKINDAYTSRYARKFVAEFPDYEDIFNFREIRSA